MRSRAMYCQTSSSVQLLIGNTRKCSPGCSRVLNSVPRSGPRALGRHSPTVSPRGQLGLPWAEAVSVREEALLGAGFFFIAAGAGEQGVEAERLDRFDQRDRLVHVARLARVGQAHAATGDQIL